MFNNQIINDMKEKAKAQYDDFLKKNEDTLKEVLLKLNTHFSPKEQEVLRVLILRQALYAVEELAKPTTGEDNGDSKTAN